MKKRQLVNLSHYVPDLVGLEKIQLTYIHILKSARVINKLTVGQIRRSNWI